MVDIPARIIQVFHQQQLMEFSTTDLVKEVYPEEYERIKASLHDPSTDREARTVAKRHKGQLHRRVLYHLNRLVEKGDLSVSSVQGKGEHCFSLKHKYITQRSHAKERALPIAQTQPLLRLEHFHEQGIITGFDGNGWHNRLNAVLLEVSPEDSCDTVYTRVAKVASNVNDVIGLHGLQHLLAREPLDALVSLLRRLDIDTRDNNKRVSLLVDLTELPETPIAEDFFEAYALIGAAHLQMVFSVTSRYLSQQSRLLKSIVHRFSSATVKVNLHDLDHHLAPLLIGRAGVYTVDDDEWRVYCEEVRGKTVGLCFAQVSVGIDVKRYFQYKHSPSSFRKFILKIARSLVESSTQQRRRADVAFKMINDLNDDPHEFFRFSVNYIRLWNYDWEDDDGSFLELFGSSAALVDEFCHTEETIFKSCGIPIRFRASISSMFPKFEKGFFSKRSYRKISVSSLDDLRTAAMQEFFQARERLFKVFANSDRIRIFRSLPANPSAVLNECKYLFSSYEFPFLCYDFAKRKENLTLDSFMG